MDPLLDGWANKNCGVIALGHPLRLSGARIVMTAEEALQRGRRCHELAPGVGHVRDRGHVFTNWFPASQLAANGPEVRKFRADLLAISQTDFASLCAAIRDMNFWRIIALIVRPTLVIADGYDTVTALSHSELIAETVPDHRPATATVLHRHDWSRSLVCSRYRRPSRMKAARHIWGRPGRSCPGRGLPIA